MKKLFVSLLSVFYVSCLLYAQNEGTIKYKINMEDVPEEYSSMSNMTMKIVWKGDKVYSETVNPYMKVISIEKPGETITLLDQGGRKMMFKSQDHKDDNNEQNNGNVDVNIEYTKEAKTILGYVCKKAIIKTKESKRNDTIEYVVWYTDKIPNKMKNSNNGNNGNISELSKIPGMPMEYSFDLQGIKVTVTVTDINYDPVPDEIFNVSTDGYQEMQYPTR